MQPPTTGTATGRRNMGLLINGMPATGDRRPADKGPHLVSKSVFRRVGKYGHVVPCMPMSVHISTYGHVCPCMAMYGHAWPCSRDIHEYIWPCIAMYGYIWPCIAMNGHVMPRMPEDGRV